MKQHLISSFLRMGISSWFLQAWGVEQPRVEREGALITQSGTWAPALGHPCLRSSQEGFCTKDWEWPISESSGYPVWHHLQTTGSLLGDMYIFPNNELLFWSDRERNRMRPSALFVEIVVCTDLCYVFVWIHTRGTCSATLLAEPGTWS